MKTTRTVVRHLYLALALACGVFGAGPAAAQKMSDDGITLPWFHSRAEQIQREACENDLPECRDSVRQQIATEKAISRTIPWILLCLAIWAAVRYARRREQQREKLRQEAARHHVRASVRAREAQTDRRDTDTPDEEADDDLGFGAPGDRGRRR